MQDTELMKQCMIDAKTIFYELYHGTLMYGKIVAIAHIAAELFNYRAFTHDSIIKMYIPEDNEAYEGDDIPF